MTEAAHVGKMYFYWGWNWSGYSKSDISFSGDNYDFTLFDVRARDRQSAFGLDYFNPTKISIPQYNFRIGYLLKNNLDISLGVDHMKYVVVQNQVTHISGQISQTGTIFDNIYSNDTLSIVNDFLKFEHTDGLNYLNIEIRKTTELLSINSLNISWIRGVGAGLILPKTNATLLTNERHDKFHLAGYGLAAIAGIRVTIYKSFFIQSEYRAGYIRMPNIRTTSSRADRASQNFLFHQFNLVFGAVIFRR